MRARRTEHDDAPRVTPGLPADSLPLTRRALREQGSSSLSAGTQRTSQRLRVRGLGLRAVPALAVGLVGVLAGTGAGAAISALRESPSATGLAADGGTTDGARDAAQQGSRSDVRDAVVGAGGLSAMTGTAGADDIDTATPAAESGGTVAGLVIAPDAVMVTDPDTDLAVVPAGMTLDDVNAGLRSRTVPTFASGEFVTVPGEVPAWGSGTVRTVRVEVEQGLDIDAPAFADFVLATLNDPRSWGGDGSQTFARTESVDAEITVTLASPDSVDQRCAPLKTNGIVSCGIADNAVLNAVRWADGSDVYGEDRESFRRYLVNHEVGHILGHQHATCGARDTRAPVMMQQSGGMISCIPNGWPFP